MSDIYGGEVFETSVVVAHKSPRVCVRIASASLPRFEVEGKPHLFTRHWKAQELKAVLNGFQGLVVRATERTHGPFRCRTLSFRDMSESCQTCDKVNGYGHHNTTSEDCSKSVL